MISPDLYGIFSMEIVGFADAGGPSASFEQLGMDSFDLISLRAAVETFVGHAIDDQLWSSFRSPKDIADAI
jgi:acyl carrier protein